MVQSVPDHCFFIYRKTPKNSDTQKFCGNHPKCSTRWPFHKVMGPKAVDGMANSVDPDLTAPLGTVLSGSTLFPKTCLSENLGPLRHLAERN